MEAKWGDPLRTFTQQEPTEQDVTEADGRMGHTRPHVHCVLSIACP